MRPFAASSVALALALAACGGTVDPLLERTEASDVENGASTACTGVVVGGTYENVTVP